MVITASSRHYGSPCYGVITLLAVALSGAGLAVALDRFSRIPGGGWKGNGDSGGQEKDGSGKTADTVFLQLKGALYQFRISFHACHVDVLVQDPVLALLFRNRIVKEVLRIRKELGKTSVKKYEAMRTCVCGDGRIRGLLS